jgi:large subunit ribosomal protein L32
MAVPKKRTSKSKRDIRKFQWKEKASLQAKKALSTALSLLKKPTEINIENQ